MPQPIPKPGSGQPICFFDLTLGGEPLGRIQFRLYSNTTPRTAENFRQFCTGEHKSPINGRPQGYKGAKFHRVIKNFMIQGGDFIHGDGTGSTSIYNDSKFDDENFLLRHDEPLLLSMANTGPDSNGCQFFITTAKANFLDGKHVVFGRVIEGEEIVRKVEQVRTNPGRGDRPVIDVMVSMCGEM